MRRLLLRAASALLTLAAIASFSSGNPQEREDKGYLGVSIQDVTRSVMKQQDLKNRDGAYVSSVVDDSPADSIGIRKGDVIVEFAGRTVYDAADLSKVVGRTQPGTKAALTLIRNRERKSFTVIVGEVPRRRESAFLFGNRPTRMRFFTWSESLLGLSLVDLNDQLASYFEAPSDQGVLVLKVTEGCAAEKAGIKAGDILLKIGSRSVSQVSEVTRAFRKYDVGEKVEIELLRKGSRKKVTVEIEDAEDGPWGVVAPRMERFGRIGVLPPPGTCKFETIGPDIEAYLEPQLDRLDHIFESFDFNVVPHIPELDFDMDAPHLDELRWKLENTEPKIRIHQEKLRRRVQELSKHGLMRDI